MTERAQQPLEESTNWDDSATGSYRSPHKWMPFDNTGTDDSEDGPNSADESGVTDEGGAGIERQHLLEDAPSEASGSEAYSMDDDPYVIGVDQKKYYDDCFAYLLSKAQPPQSENILLGAIQGTDTAVLDFFRKSNLTKDQLRQIWTLADVNQDGWLNRDEFHVAMHLCVNYVKGGVPLPEYLPSHMAPTATPPRRPPTPSHDMPDSTVRNSGSPPQTPRNVHGITATSDKMSPQLSLREFSAAPPVANATHTLEKPIAVKADAASNLSPMVRKGPPPAPPPRPQRQSHTRSASLDLNLKAIIAAGQSEPAAQPITSARQSSTLPKNAVPPSAFHAQSSTQHPPTRSSVELRESQTQTDVEDTLHIETIRQGDNNQSMLDFDAIANAPTRALEAHVDEEYPLDWRGKCHRLRRENGELEAERSRLAQIRVQLEMRLQQLKGNSS